MQPAEFAALVSTLTICALLATYIAILAKLKPSNADPRPEGNAVSESGASRKRLVSVANEKDWTKETRMPTDFRNEDTITVQEAQIRMPQESVSGNRKKGSQEKESKKSFLLFGEKTFEGCPHNFGHLKKLPKNTPIPDECFGCGQILECVASKKTDEK